MKVRDAIKEYQRRLTELDHDHSRAKDRLASAREKRAKLLEEQDRLVTAAEREVDDAIAAMAREAGPELTASLLDVEVARVRRLMKDRRGGTGVTAASGPASGPSSGRD